MTEKARPDLRLVPRNADDAPDLPLPAEDTGAELDTVVYDAELVDAAEPRARLLPDVIVEGITVVRSSPKTAKAVRVVALHGVRVAQGWHSWWVRAGDGLSYGVYRRQIRAAEVIGDQEALAAWVDRKERAVAARRSRLMDLPLLAVNVAKFLGISLLGALMLLLALSIAVWATGVGSFSTVWELTGDLIGFILTVLKYMWPAIPAGIVVAAWREGHRKGTPPTWLAKDGDAGGRNSTPVMITPSVVVTALRDIGYAPLRKAIKDMGDAGAAMLSPIRIAGCGVEVDVTLPSGTSTDEIEKRRRKLAENLGRHLHELFITIPEQARTVRLWIADPGALDEPIGPSPLVTSKEIDADYENGQAPWGQNLRGEAATISLYQRHLLITGLSNQGKTAALRALALWLAFTNVRFRIADLKGIGDWAMFKGIAEVLIQGPTDEHVAAATAMVEWGVDEMERRLQAPPGTRFDPVVLIVDEAQQAFMCPAKDEDGVPYGGTKSNSRYFIATRKIHNQGRAVDVLLWQGTQNPTDQNLPVLVREGAHIRASLVVGTESQSRMALGENAVNAGAAPHLLRQDLDRGTVVTNGGGMKLPVGQTSITIRTHYVAKEEAAEVADRARARRAGTATLDDMPVEDRRDPLADIAAVLRNEPRVLTQEVLYRLAERDPGRYRTWAFADLTRVLEDAGAAPYKSDGRMVVGRDRVISALANREESDA
ncbi:FtsK/SpoIIIE domain-containing protein [Nonomuraea typhae]|uniref:FtsK/SpoIIIE domain-containing protein n=1 Tax=Nonomuraea typhae TaxID=2603600 RepID=UPI001CA5316E|nr:FtsK/SpoIIIE domain-containing protein [Nonomuraea typhae]